MRRVRFTLPLPYLLYGDIWTLTLGGPTKARLMVPNQGQMGACERQVGTPIQTTQVDGHGRATGREKEERAKGNLPLPSPLFASPSE